MPSLNRTSQLTLQAFTPSAVEEALQAIDCRKATGEDKLYPDFLKLCAPFIAGQKIGIVSQVWKSANVVPPHKGGDKNNVNNYWPISTLSCLAKVLVSLVDHQLK